MVPNNTRLYAEQPIKHNKIKPYKFFSLNNGHVNFKRIYLLWLNTTEIETITINMTCRNFPAFTYVIHIGRGREEKNLCESDKTGFQSDEDSLVITHVRHSKFNLSLKGARISILPSFRLRQPKQFDLFWNCPFSNGRLRLPLHIIFFFSRGCKQTATAIIEYHIHKPRYLNNGVVLHD